MPVNRHVIEQALPVRQVAASQASDDEDEGGNSRKNMQSVQSGKDIEERAVRICGEIESLGRKLAPSETLPCDEGHPKPQGGRQPSERHGNSPRGEFRTACVGATRYLHGAAA